MTDYVKITGLVFIAVFVCIVLSNQHKSFSVLIAIAACCIVTYSAVEYIDPVVVFFKTLEEQGNWNHELLEILIKSVGIGFISEVVGNICSDAGHSAMGKTLQMLSTVLILWISLPIFTSLMELINKMLGGL